MRNFFRKLGRFIRKIFQTVLKIIAVILAIILVAVLIMAVVSATTGYTFANLSVAMSSLTGSFVAWIGSVVPGATGAWLTEASLAVKGWIYSEWIAAAAVSFGVGFGLMPEQMEWAVSRIFNGVRYVGQTAIKVAGSIAETGVEVVGGVVNTVAKTALGSPALLLAGAAAFFFLRSRPAATVAIANPGITGGAT